MTAASTGLNVPAEGALDFLALGALIHRLDPGVIPFRKAHTCEIHVSGGEFNTAANLADCFGLRTGVATAMVDTRSASSSPAASGRWASRRSTRCSSTTACAGRTWRPSTAIAASACAAPTVFYNRCNEAAAQLKPGDFDWETIFGAGVRWFHSGGIFASLSETHRRADHRRHGSGAPVTARSCRST